MQFYKLALATTLLTGCALFNKQPTVTLRFHEQVSDVLPESHVRMVDVPGTGSRIAVDPFAQLNERDVYKARLEPMPGGQAVRLQFDLHGANKLSEMTTRIRGRYLVVFYNDRPIATVLMENRITNGVFVLEGDLTEEEERTLVDGLNKFAGRRRDIGDTRYAP